MSHCRFCNRPLKQGKNWTVGAERQRHYACVPICPQASAAKKPAKRAKTVLKLQDNKVVAKKIATLEKTIRKVGKAMGTFVVALDEMFRSLPEPNHVFDSLTKILK